MIREKKAEAAVGLVSQDILSTFILGGYMSDAEIGDKIMGMLVAGYSTVATTMTFFVKYVRERPEVYHKVLTGNNSPILCCTYYVYGLWNHGVGLYWDLE